MSCSHDGINTYINITINHYGEDCPAPACLAGQSPGPLLPGKQASSLAAEAGGPHARPGRQTTHRPRTSPRPSRSLLRFRITVLSSFGNPQHCCEASSAAAEGWPAASAPGTSHMQQHADGEHLRLLGCADTGSRQSRTPRSASGRCQSLGGRGRPAAQQERRHRLGTCHPLPCPARRNSRDCLS